MWINYVDKVPALQLKYFTLILHIHFQSKVKVFGIEGLGFIAGGGRMQGLEGVFWLGFFVLGFWFGGCLGFFGLCGLGFFFNEAPWKAWH